MSLVIRDAAPGDEALILGFIRVLAEHEGRPHLVTATEEKIGKLFFGPDRIADAIIAEWDGKPVGHALFYMSISSYLGEPLVYLEDVVVDPSFRGKGVGKALLADVAARGVARGAVRMYWSAIPTNDSAIAIYQHLGAHKTQGDLSFKLEGEELYAFAKQALPK